MSNTLDKVFKEFREREALGLSKYNTTVDREDLSSVQWLQHLREEMMDGLLYLTRLKETMEKLDERLSTLESSGRPSEG